MKIKPLYLNEFEDGEDLSAVDDVVVEESEPSFDDVMEKAFEETENIGGDEAADQSEQPSDEEEPAPEVEEVAEDKEQEEGEAEAYLEELKKDDSKQVQAKQFERLLQSRGEYKKELEELKPEVERLRPIEQNYKNLTDELFVRGDIHPNDLKPMIDLFEGMKNNNVSPESVDFFKGFAKMFAGRFNVDLSEVNVFAEYPDIQQRVANLELSEADAREIVKAREHEKVTHLKRQQQEQNASFETEVKQAEETAIANIQSLAQGYSGIDPDFEVKNKMVIPKLKAAIEKERLHPSEWQTRYTDIYNTVSETARQTIDHQKQQRDTNTLEPNGISGKDASPDVNLDNFVDIFAQKEGI